MKQTIIIDTGPLVAFVNQNDMFHQWTTAHLDKLTPPLLTCEAVITEACYLLRNIHGGEQAILQQLERNLIKISFSLSKEITAIRKLVKKYADTPMSLADASLVRMSEIYANSKIFTLDSDFSIYRQHGRQVIPTIFPTIT